MTILNVKDSQRLEVLRQLTDADPAYYAILNRPHQDLEQRTKDLDRIFTPARGLRVRQTSTPSDDVEIETGVLLDTDGVSVIQANSGSIQTISSVPAAAAGKIRADLVYFNLQTKVAVRLAGSEVPVGTGFSSGLWPDLPSGLAGAVPLGVLYVGENIGGSVNFSDSLSGNVEGQIVDVRPSIGVLTHRFETNVANFASDVTSGSVGTSVLIARADHRHPLNVDGTAPTTVAAGTAASTGAAATYARRDHQHAVTVETNSGVLLKDSSSPSAGTTGAIVRADHRHPLNVNTGIPNVDGVGAAGAAGAYARSDHRHPLNVPSSGTPADLGAGVSATHGVAATYARSDHVHDVANVALQSAIFTLTWSASSSAMATGAIGFVPKYAIVIFGGYSGGGTNRPVMSVGVVTGTASNAKSVMAAEKADASDNDYTVSTDADSAFGQSFTAGGYISSHDTMEGNVTSFSAAGITITPTTSLTGTAFLLVVGQAQ